MTTTTLDRDIGDLEEMVRFRRPRERARVRRIPYDYVSRFTLTGRQGNVVPATINISAEARFVCFSIGYTIEIPPVKRPQSAEGVRSATEESLLRVSPTAHLRTGLETAAKNLGPPVETVALTSALYIEWLAFLQSQNMREGISFTYAITDKGSGRELQSEPIHNLAGLGKPNGERPFRELNTPYVFDPNSTIVIELHELSTLSGAIVYMDFQGFKEM